MKYAHQKETRGARATLRALALLILAAALYAPSRAHAGGFWLTDRGARPLARGFAFVAGADDPQSLWYNPAGLAWSGQQLMLDASYTFFDGTYARVDSGGNQLPAIDIPPTPVPIPGIAYSHPLNDEWTIGAGIFAPNALLVDYHDYFDQNGQPCNPDDGDITCVAPQRYSLQTMDGSALAIFALGAAFRPREELSIGFGTQIIAGVFSAETTLNGCDGAICVQPEDPENDGYARISAPVIDFGPTAGITYDAGPVRIGASLLWWPRALRGTGTMEVRLPASPLFSGGHLEGNKAKIAADFPLQVRLGVEVQPIEAWRVEAAVVWEQWSTEKALTIEPQNVWMRDVLALGDYQVGPISIPRNMNDVWSLRLGSTISPLANGSIEISFGANYENSSFDDAYLTPLTIDTRKLVVGGGVSARVMDGLWFDVSFAHVFLEDRNVTNSAVPQPNAIRPPQSPEITAYIGNGQYTMEANMIAGGLRWQIGRGAEDDPETGALPPAPAAPRVEEAELDPAAEPIRESLVTPVTEPTPAAAAAATEPAPPVAGSAEPTVVGDEPPPTARRTPRRLRTAADPDPYR